MNALVKDVTKDKWLNHPSYPLVLENLEKFCKSDWKTKHYGMSFNFGERTYRFIEKVDIFGSPDRRRSFEIIEVKDTNFNFTDEKKVWETWKDNIFGENVETLGFYLLRTGFRSKEVRTKKGRERVARFLVFRVFDRV